MTETQGSGPDLPPGDGAEELRGAARPAPGDRHATARPGQDPAGGAPGRGRRRPAARELPAEPPDLPQAKRAERVVAALFLLSMLASIGFIAAYVGLEVGSVSGAPRSNLALGVSMSVAFGALAVGAVIWVRFLMPQVELTEERKPLASSPQQRAEFERDVHRGRRGQRVRQAEAGAADPDRGHRAARARPDRAPA